MISLIEIKENIITKTHAYKQKINFDNEAEVELNKMYNNDTKKGSNEKEVLSIKNKDDEGEEDDEDDGFYCTSTGNNIKQTISVTNNSKEGSFDRDILLQGTSKFIGTVVRPIPNIKEHGKYSYPSRLYIMKTKANVWLASSMMYRDVDKCPFLESFWQSKIIGNEKEEDMKKLFKFHLISNLQSKESSLISKQGGRTNNVYWKAII